MSFASRTGSSWDAAEGFVHATASTASVSVLERPAAANVAGPEHAAADGADPLSGLISPGRMRADRKAGSAYSPDLSRALKAVVKVGRCWWWLGSGWVVGGGFC